MYIYVGQDWTVSGAELRDADNFREFKVTIEGSPDQADAATALSALGCMIDDRHAMLRQQAIVDLPGGRPEDPEWRASFDAMVEYAASKGWVDGDGAIRAHVEWSDA